MGVKCVFPYRMIPDLNALNELARLVETLHPEKTEIWSVICEIYFSKTSESSGSPKPTELLIFSFNESPSNRYFLIDESALETDVAMQTIIEQEKLFISRRRISIVGHQYFIGDFVVKFGSIKLGETNKGIVMEVEYTPCMIPNRCTEILQEFLGKLRT